LGIDVWARRGIAGCGVLPDVARACESFVNPSTRRLVRDHTELLDRTAELQRAQIGVGDILLVRPGGSGGTRPYRATTNGAYGPASAQPGLVATEAMAAWLWDHHIAAVAADNSALETSPLDMTPGNFLHIRLIAGFGMPIGEHFWLDDLARACAADGRWRFLLTSAPLNVPDRAPAECASSLICDPSANGHASRCADRMRTRR
jgi:hypothetical protein